MTARIIATTPEGHQACFVIDVPPSAEDLRRAAALIASTDLADATWTAEPGTSAR